MKKNKQHKDQNNIKDLVEIEFFSSGYLFIGNWYVSLRYFTEEQTFIGNRLKKSHSSRGKELKVRVHSQKMAEQAVRLN